MEFNPKDVPVFLANFDRVHNRIRNFPGCIHLKLLQDKKAPEIFFTYSRWESEADLEAYRQSELFRSVWATTKQLFRSKAQAWSVDVRYEV